MVAVDRAARHGLLVGGTIEGGWLRADRLEAASPSGADELILDLHRRMPEVRITDLLLDVDEVTGFTDAFTDLRTGSVCREKIGLQSAVLADGLNLGLKKMAASAATHTHWQRLCGLPAGMSRTTPTTAPSASSLRLRRPCPWRASGARG